MSRSIFYTSVQHENFKFWNYFQLNFSCLLIRKSNHLNGNKKKFQQKVYYASIYVFFIYLKKLRLFTNQLPSSLSVEYLTSDEQSIWKKKHTHNSDKPITPLKWSIACLSLYRSMHKTLCKMN